MSSTIETTTLNYVGESEVERLRVPVRDNDFERAVDAGNEIIRAALRDSRRDRDEDFANIPMLYLTRRDFEELLPAVYAGRVRQVVEVVEERADAVVREDMGVVAETFRVQAAGEVDDYAVQAADTVEEVQTLATAPADAPADEEE